jgi:zinc protease
MLFKGTARRGVGEIAGEVEGAGGRINAFTSFDVTAYHATLPSDRIEVGLDVLCDAVQHSRFEPEEIRREIEVVIEEINRSEDSPGHVLGDAIFAESYHVHPYRRPILGSAESVASFDQAKIRAFYDRWYAPDNLTAVAVGDFDTRELVASLARHFSDAQPRGVRRERPAEPRQQGMRTTLLTRPFERTHLDLSWPGVGLGDPDAALLDLLAFVLGGCESSRLVRRVKEREGLADRIDASSYTPLDPGTFSVSLETDAERASEAIQACIREVARLRIGAVTAAELEIARTNFLASEHFERESVTGVANKLGSFHLFAGDYRAETQYLDAVRNATPEQLYRVAAEYLSPERLTVGGVLHEGATPVLDEAQVKESVDHGLERCTRAFSVPDSLGTSGEMQSYRLPGGSELHVLPRREVPVVAARAVFLGGLLAEDEGSSGLTSFLGSMWLRGTRSRSAADFARATESLAAEIDCFTGRSSFGLTLETPSERIEPTLASAATPSPPSRDARTASPSSRSCSSRRPTIRPIPTDSPCSARPKRSAPSTATASRPTTPGSCARPTWPSRWWATSTPTRSRCRCRRVWRTSKTATSKHPARPSRTPRARCATPSSARTAPRRIW